MSADVVSGAPAVPTGAVGSGDPVVPGPVVPGAVEGDDVVEVDDEVDVDVVDDAADPATDEGPLDSPTSCGATTPGPPAAATVGSAAAESSVND